MIIPTPIAPHPTPPHIHTQYRLLVCPRTILPIGWAGIFISVVVCLVCIWTCCECTDDAGFCVLVVARSVGSGLVLALVNWCQEERSDMAEGLDAKLEHN